jgi:uncharacterized repeat protein (TIGR01451 family)
MINVKHFSFSLLLATALEASLIPTLVNSVQAREEAGVVTIQAATPKTPIVGQPYTFTVFVKNDSVDQRVNLVDLLPTSASLVSATPSQGSCDLLRHGSGDGQDAVECTLGMVPSGSMAEVEIIVTPRAPGVMTNTASATPEISPATAANSSSASVRVKPAPVVGT